MCKGVVLAGGTGSRLRPLTEVTNKHLLPIYDWPMIFYPINTLKQMGVKDICIVVGGNSVGDILNLLGDGSRFGVRLTYKHQKDAGGIAQALELTRDFVGGDSVTVILGDNIFLKTPKDIDACSELPWIVTTVVQNPEEFGCVVWSTLEDDKGNLLIDEIIEKPVVPPSNDIVTGLYHYPNGVFNMIDTLKPSERGELEITDVNNMMIEKYGGINSSEVEEGMWLDAGCVESIFLASSSVREAKIFHEFTNSLGKVRNV
jgi:glucose-1-phosphate thymidylyltransferase